MAFPAELFTANLASTVVSSGGGDAPSSGTSETWTVTSSAQFGAASTGLSQFHVSDPAAPSEVIAVTNVSGTTWTVTRGAESTIPVTHLSNFTVRQVLTAGFLAGIGALTNLGLAPSGDSTGATDTTVINNLLATSGIGAVGLQAGTFYVNQPLLVPSGLKLQGAKGCTTSVYDGGPPSTGTIIKGVAAFTSGGLGTPAVVRLNGDGSHLWSFWIDASLIAISCDAVNDGSGHKAIDVRNVGIYMMNPGSGFGHGFAQFGTAWHMFECLVNMSWSSGFYGAWTDSVLINCHGQTCGLNASASDGAAFKITGAESKLIGCRGDLSQNGFLIDAALSSPGAYADVVQLVGCSTQRNNHDGVLVTNSSATGQAGRCPVLISGHVSDGDGVNGTVSTSGGGTITGGLGGGGYAGIRAEGNNAVVIDGWWQTAGTRDASAGCPAYSLTTGTTGSGPGKPLRVSAASAQVNPITGVFNDTASVGIDVGGNVAAYTGAVYLGNSSTPLSAVRPTFPGAILGLSQFAPGTQASKTVTGTTYAAFDTTNLTTPAFTAPPSGNVKVAVSLNAQTNTASDKMFLALAAHGSVSPLVADSWECTDSAAGAPRMYTAEFSVTGLTPSASYQFDLLGAGTSGTTVTILAFGQSGTTPVQSGGSPVTFTVSAA